MLEKMDLVEVDETDTTAIRFIFPPAPPAGKVVVEAAGVSKKYDPKLVLDNIDLAVINSEKVAFVGKNGEGEINLSKNYSEPD